MYIRTLVPKLSLISHFNCWLVKQWKFTDGSARLDEAGETSQAPTKKSPLHTCEKINLSNYEQNPLSDLMLSVKITKIICWHRSPPWPPSLPQVIWVIRRWKIQTKFPRHKHLKRQMVSQFRTLSIPCNRENSEVRSRSVRAGTTIRGGSQHSNADPGTGLQIKIKATHLFSKQRKS